MKPRTRVYTSETGESQLLLCLYGSLPSPIGGRVYKIPIELWIPHEYPIAAPFVYVVPTEKMTLQPGNHVDNSGRCYSPYLANWGQNQDGNQSHIIKVCEELSRIFSNEPPVFAKPTTKTQTPPIIQQNLQPKSSPAPALPPKVAPNLHQSGSATPLSPPPLPPLPEELRSKTIASPTLNRMDHLAIQQRPAQQIPQRQMFEQPNIMDNDSSFTNNDNTERVQLLSQLENLLQHINQFEIGEDIHKMNSNINKIKYSIGKFDKIFQYEFHNLEKTSQQLKENEQILKNSIMNADSTIQNANSHGEINVDEIICGETVVFNQ